uniref:Uncharacterized protein n=1 Tax=Romanomermis culicivorax TaxID=13658 RepID=A0A915L6C9_ROMCU
MLPIEQLTTILLSSKSSTHDFFKQKFARVVGIVDRFLCGRKFCVLQCGSVAAFTMAHFCAVPKKMRNRKTSPQFQTRNYLREQGCSWRKQKKVWFRIKDLMRSMKAIRGLDPRKNHFFKVVLGTGFPIRGGSVF